MLPMLNNRLSQRWNDLFPEMHSDMDNVVSQFFNKGGTWDGLTTYPVNIHEDEDYFHVEAELPGFKKDEINITFENGMLSIQAERKVEESKGEQHLTERRYSKYARRFNMPSIIDEANIDASLEDGVLHLKLPKKPEVKPRRIELK